MAFKDREKARAYDRARYAANPEKKKLAARQYAAANREKVRTKCRRYYQANKDRARAWRINDRKKNPEKHRERNRRQRGMPEPTRPCPERCECCGGPPTRKGFHLDHDHKTGKFRGWLCSNCNTGTGKLGDSIEGLQRAIEYLKRAAIANSEVVR